GRSVAYREMPTEPLKECGVAEGQGVRIVDRVGIGPVQRADEAVAQMRLHLGKLGRAERHGIDAELARSLGLGEIGVQWRRVVVSPDEADRAQQLGRSRLLGKLLMLSGAGGNEPAPLRRDLGIAPRL